MTKKQCSTCNEEKLFSDFPAQKKRDGSLTYRPHCYACKYTKEVLSGRIQNKEYHREYYYSHKLDIKYKAYRHNDISKYKSDNLISRDDAVLLMMRDCHYCGVSQGHGLDRKDSSVGYTLDNVVSCCEKCNFILGDIPYLAKIEMIVGLTSINKKGLLEKWIIPTKRK